MRTFKSMPGTEVGVAGETIKFNSEGIFKTSDEKVADILAKARYVEELNAANEPEALPDAEPKGGSKKGKA